MKQGRTAASWLSAVAGAVALVGCAPAGEAVEKPVALVDVATVQPVPHASRQVLTGSVEAHAQTPAAFLISGRLVALDAAVGDRVGKGQVLARLAPGEQRADVVAAEAALQAAQSRRVQTRSTFDRQTSLFRQGLTTRSALDAARTAWETAQGSVDSAQAQLRLAGEALGYTELVASASGVVIRRLAEVGEVVQTGSPVYVIAEDGPRNAVINVQETAIAGWDRDRQVTVAPVSSRQPPVTGKVSEIAPALDITGTVQVKVALDADLPLGAPVTVVLQAPAQERVLLPAQALAQSRGSPTVWRVSADRTVEQAPVAVESYETGSVIISGGLQAGDVVVTGGTQFLFPGQIVEIRSEPTR